MARCHLCDADSQLVEGHLFPRFAFNQYVTDKSHGGSFIDLAESREHNRQLKYPWFCNKCDNITLSSLEKYAAEICRKIQAGTIQTLEYDVRLLGFTTLMSWKVVKHNMLSEKDHIFREMMKPASRKWKNYLAGYGDDVRPYSQHLFIVRNPVDSGHMLVGGQVVFENSFVLWQIGPLLGIGLLARSNLSLKEIAIWQKSEVVAQGGAIDPIQKWVVGDQITRRLAEFLQHHEIWKRVQSIATWQKRQKRAITPSGPTRFEVEQR